MYLITKRPNKIKYDLIRSNTIERKSKQIVEHNLFKRHAFVPNCIKHCHAVCMTDFFALLAVPVFETTGLISTLRGFRRIQVKNVFEFEWHLLNSPSVICTNVTRVQYVTLGNICQVHEHQCFQVTTDKLWAHMPFLHDIAFPFEDKMVVQNFTSLVLNHHPTIIFDHEMEFLPQVSSVHMKRYMLGVAREQLRLFSRLKNRIFALQIADGELVSHTKLEHDTRGKIQWQSAKRARVNDA